jgi:hypothetical protein
LQDRECVCVYILALEIIQIEKRMQRDKLIIAAREI